MYKLCRYCTMKKQRNNGLNIFFLLKSKFFCYIQNAHSNPRNVARWCHWDFSYHIMPHPGFEPTSVELHRPGTFEGCSTNRATAPRKVEYRICPSIKKLGVYQLFYLWFCLGSITVDLNISPFVLQISNLDQ